MMDENGTQAVRFEWSTLRAKAEAVLHHDEIAKRWASPRYDPQRDGYCYLYAFVEAQRDQTAARLGSFPTVAVVLEELCSAMEVMSVDVVVVGNLVHMTEGGGDPEELLAQCPGSFLVGAGRELLPAPVNVQTVFAPSDESAWQMAVLDNAGVQDMMALQYEEIYLRSHQLGNAYGEVVPFGQSLQPGNAWRSVRGSFVALLLPQEYCVEVRGIQWKFGGLRQLGQAVVLYARHGFDFRIAAPTLASVVVREYSLAEADAWRARRSLSATSSFALMAQDLSAEFIYLTNRVSRLGEYLDFPTRVNDPSYGDLGLQEITSVFTSVAEDRHASFLCGHEHGIVVSAVIAPPRSCNELASVGRVRLKPRVKTVKFAVAPGNYAYVSSSFMTAVSVFRVYDSEMYDSACGRDTIADFAVHRI